MLSPLPISPDPFKGVNFDFPSIVTFSDYVKEFLVIFMPFSVDPICPGTWFCVRTMGQFNQAMKCPSSYCFHSD